MKRLIPLLVLLLIVALAAIGVGYGLWYEILHVDGVVNTGNVDVEWSLRGSEIIGDWKKIATCTTSLDPLDKDTLLVTLGNWFPEISCIVNFDVHSTGSIPVHVMFDKLDWLPMTGPFSAMDLSCSGPGYVGNPFEQFVQLHEGEEMVCSFIIHANNDLKQLAEYKFGWRAKAWQYNEVWAEPAP